MQLTGIEGKVAIVTGAAQGIGAGVAQALAAAGASLLLTDRNAEGLTQITTTLQGSGAQVEPLAAELGDAAQATRVVEHCVERYGRVDALINVAGVFRAGSVLELGIDDFDLIFAVNTRAVFLLTQAAGRHMATQQAGSVVTIASNAALVPRVMQSAYCASKAAVTHLMRCFGLELAQYGIRVNSVLPGAADTPMVQQLRATMRPGDADESVAGSLEKFRNAIPLGRLAPVDQIAAAVAFLLSDQAAHITMQSLVVDGGGALGG